MQVGTYDGYIQLFTMARYHDNIVNRDKMKTNYRDKNYSSLPNCKPSVHTQMLKHTHIRTPTHARTHAHTHTQQITYKISSFECPNFYFNDINIVKVNVTQSVHVLNCISINALNFVESSQTKTLV